MPQFSRVAGRMEQKAAYGEKKEKNKEGVRGYKAEKEVTILLFFPNFQHMLHSYFWSTEGIRKDKIGRVISGGRQSRLGMENRRRECCPGSSEVRLAWKYWILMSYSSF